MCLQYAHKRTHAQRHTLSQLHSRDLIIATYEQKEAILYY